MENSVQLQGNLVRVAVRAPGCSAPLPPPLVPTIRAASNPNMRGMDRALAMALAPWGSVVRKEYRRRLRRQKQHHHPQWLAYWTARWPL